MSPTEARALKPGDRVDWNLPGRECGGVVAAHGDLECGLYVRWDGDAYETFYFYEEGGTVGVGYLSRGAERPQHDATYPSGEDLPL